MFADKGFLQVAFHQTTRCGIVGGVFFFFFSFCCSYNSGLALASEPECPEVRNVISVAKQNDVYQNTPFSVGEEQHFELYYMGVFVGFGKLEVKPPVKHNGLWHNVFAAGAKTAPSYEMFFKGDEKMMAYSLPGSFSVSQFAMEQNEKKILSDPYIAEKWITFNHDKCYVKETILEKGKSKKVKRFDLVPGATDILSSFYQLRSRKYSLGKMERFLIYTSEKTWWAEATPVAFEKVKVPAGEFKTVKLSMKTFIGKVAEQSGDMFVWLAIDRKEAPMVKIMGEVKIGSIELELAKFVPGKK